MPRLRQREKALGEKVGERSGERTGAARGQAGTAEAQPIDLAGLRASEERFRSLVNLSNDWYWEQDAEYRFTRLEGRSVAGGDPKLAARLLGKRRWESGLEAEGGWEAHRAQLEARQPFHDLVLSRALPDGGQRWMSVSGEPVFEHGRFVGYRGIGRDISEQKRGERLLRLEHGVTRALAAASEAAQALRAALRILCESESWDYAEFWKPEGSQGRLHRFVAWCAPEVPEAQQFFDKSRGRVFGPGEGLVGAVWQSGEPIWIADTTQDTRAARREISLETGLRAALVYPVRSGARTAGIIAFCCRAIRAPDERMLQTLSVIAAQIAQYLSRAQVEQALRESEARFRRTFELAGSGIAHVSLEGRFLRVNRRLCETLGYTEAELVGKALKDLSHPEDRDLADQPRRRVLAGELDAVRLEKRYLRKDGTVVWMAIVIALERDAEGRPLYAISVLEDVTRRKQSEAALRESEARFRGIIDSANEGILVYDTEFRVLDMNSAAERIIGLPRSEIVGKHGFTSLLPCVREDGAPLRPEERATRRTAATGKPLAGVVIGIVRPGGAITWLSVNTGLLRRPGEEKWYGIVSTISDITAARRAQDALRESEELFRKTFELAASGVAHVSLDGRFLRVNARLCEMLGYAQRELVGRSVKDVSHPEDRDVTDAQRALVRAGERESVRFEKRYVRKDGAVVWVSLGVALVRSHAGAPAHEIAMFDDITERKHAEQALRQAHEELKRSNSELEQFAYVASHDLQEPLRMVSSYTQLLARRYDEKFDADAKEFMAYIVDGAARMKQLIEDLLAYSRVGTKGKEFRPVELEKPLKRALANLKGAIDESRAQVTHDPLPIAPADEMQLAQLFQNLIGNALKFRGEAPPRVHVSCAEGEGHFEIAVRDNGIGIEPQYFERIFMVFQRLHMKGEYPGTGIGLAICKKVVERHGGQIRVESKPGEGSAFIFTLPKRTMERSNGG